MSVSIKYWANRGASWQPARDSNTDNQLIETEWRIYASVNWPSLVQIIIWTNAGILLIGPLGTNFNEILIKIHTFSFKKIHFKISSGNWQPFCLCLNVLNRWTYKDTHVHSKEYEIKFPHDFILLCFMQLTLTIESCHEDNSSSLVIMTTSSADSNHNTGIMMTLSQTGVSLDN